MTDRFGSHSLGTSSPATKVLTITPHDDNDLSEVVRALYIGVAGNAVVITKEGDTVTFVGLQAGQILPVRVSRVKATNTTATSILGLV